MLSLKRTCLIGFSHLGVESIWMLIFVYMTQRSDSPSPRPTGENPVWVTLSLFPQQGRGRAYLIGKSGKQLHSTPSFTLSRASSHRLCAPPVHPHPWPERLLVPSSLQLGGRPGLSYAEEELSAPTLTRILHHSPYPSQRRYFSLFKKLCSTV